ncbi:MAG: TRAP transporter small permease [Pseudomonadota bacterium]
MKMNAPSSGRLSRLWFCLATFLDGLTRLSLYLSCLTLLLLLAAYVYEVVVRYLFNTPTSWTYDLSTWFLGASVMLALPEITRRDSNIVISFIMDKLPLGYRQAAKRVIHTAAFIFCLLAALICFQETVRQIIHGIETYWSNPVPKWWVSIMIPFGFAISGFQFLRTGLKPVTPET